MQGDKMLASEAWHYDALRGAHDIAWFTNLASDQRVVPWSRSNPTVAVAPCQTGWRGSLPYPPDAACRYPDAPLATHVEVFGRDGDDALSFGKYWSPKAYWKTGSYWGPSLRRTPLNALHGGRGNDVITTRNGGPEAVFCDAGNDRAVVDTTDTADPSCETVEVG